MAKETAVFTINFSSFTYFYPGKKTSRRYSIFPGGDGRKHCLFFTSGFPDWQVNKMSWKVEVLGYGWFWWFFCWITLLHIVQQWFLFPPICQWESRPGDSPLPAISSPEHNCMQFEACLFVIFLPGFVRGLKSGICCLCHLLSMSYPFLVTSWATYCRPWLLGLL